MGKSFILFCAAPKGGISFFHMRGEKILGGEQAVQRVILVASGHVMSNLRMKNRYLLKKNKYEII